MRLAGRARLAAFAAVLVLSAGFSAQALQPDEVLADPALEHRARDISAGLRCLVCQNQSIDESDAPLARDLRIIVRERLKGGDSDEGVRDFLVQRYGEFVLLRPVFSAHTALLWGGPALILAITLAALFAGYVRRNRVVSTPLSSNEQAALDRLLHDRDLSSS